MEEKYKVIINDNGKEKVYDFSNCDVFCPINFAMGYVECLVNETEIYLCCPCVQVLDGYHWWTRGGNYTIKVVNGKGQVVSRRNCDELKC